MGGGGWGGSEIVSKHIQEVYTNTKYSFHKLTHININSQTDSSQNKQTLRQKTKHFRRQTVQKANKNRQTSLLYSLLDRQTNNSQDEQTKNHQTDRQTVYETNRQPVYKTNIKQLLDKHRNN